MRIDQSNIPEVIDVNDILAIRSAHLPGSSDLGPSDLITIDKDTLHTYFHISGYNFDSISSIAVLLDSLKKSFDNGQLWFGKHTKFNIKKCTFSTFNSIRGLDLQVEVNYPGALNFKILNRDGEVTVTVDDLDAFIEECYISSIVRSIITNDQDINEQTLVEILKLNPLYDHSSIEQFLKSFIKYFPISKLFGSNEFTNETTLLDNHLLDCFFTVVNLTDSHEHAIKIVEELPHPEKIVLIVRLFFDSNNDFKAINLIHETLQTTVSSLVKSNLLFLQSLYLNKKNKYSISLKLAIMAVNLNPSNFNYWINLSQIYYNLTDFENSLLVLNSCPLILKFKYAFKNFDNVAAASLHLPTPNDVFIDGITNINSKDIISDYNNLNGVSPLVNSSYFSLTPSLKRIYDVITLIIKKTNWDTVLAIRSKIFVMDDEKNSPIKSKRICEKWFDELFKLLFNDLKFQINEFTNEIKFSSYNEEELKKPFEKLGQWNVSCDDYTQTKNSVEWEFIGLLNYRLNNFKKAQIYLERSISIRYNLKSAITLLRIYLSWRQKLVKSMQDFKKFDLIILKLVISLSTFNYKWYTQFSCEILNALKTVTNDLGSTKVKNEVISWFQDQGVERLIEKHISLLADYKAIELDE